MARWFNPLIFGLVPTDDNGVTARAALAEVEQMKTAALLFAKNCGWSEPRPLKPAQFIQRRQASCRSGQLPWSPWGSK